MNFVRFEHALRWLLTLQICYPTLYLLAALTIGKPIPRGMVVFNQGRQTGVSKYVWAGQMVGVSPSTVMAFIAACNVAALIGFWTDSVFGMSNAASACLIIMYVSVAYTFSAVGSEAEVWLPCMLAALNALKLLLAKPRAPVYGPDEPEKTE